MSAPQPVLDLAAEYRHTSDRTLRDELKKKAYRELVEAGITDISRMVELVRESFGEERA